MAKLPLTLSSLLPKSTISKKSREGGRREGRKYNAKSTEEEKKNLHSTNFLRSYNLKKNKSLLLSSTALMLADIYVGA